MDNLKELREAEDNLFYGCLNRHDAHYDDWLNQLDDTHPAKLKESLRWAEADYTSAWELDEQIDELQKKIAERKSTPVTGQNDIDLRDVRVAELEAQIEKLVQQYSTISEQTATPASVVAENASDGDEPWKEKARAHACEIIKRDGAKDLYPSQVHVADEIAKQFRLNGVKGVDGKPLTGAYIKRHALKGISSAQSKLVSTVMRQSK